MSVGRPPIGKRAMTDGERHRRYFARLRAARAEDERLRRENIWLRARLKHLRTQIKKAKLGEGQK